MDKDKWVSVREYCRIKGILSPQIVYNRIARGELEFREIEVVVKRKQVKI